jgi:hypothetical protein
MNEEDARWQEILDAREELAGPSEIADQPVPLDSVRRSRAGRGGRKSQLFNEALSDLGSWSTAEAPRRRLSA